MAARIHFQTIATGGGTPSGVTGSVQFSDGTNFDSDATNFFWDNTNKRLGIGTNAPLADLQILGDAVNNTLKIDSGVANRNLTFGPNGQMSFINDNDFIINYTTGATNIFRLAYSGNSVKLNSDGYQFANYTTNIIYANLSSSGLAIGLGVTTSSAKVHVKGSGTTSATTALLVQNSAGVDILKVRDDGNIGIFSGRIFDGSNNDKSMYFLPSNISVLSNFQSVSLRVYDGVGYNSGLEVVGAAAESRVGIGTITPNASAKLQIDSTTKGFLPPRMTAAQINAIVAPADGLVAFNTDIQTLCFYGSGAWQKISHAIM